MEKLDPRSTALLLLDLQKGILGIAAGGPHSAAQVLSAAGALARRFRQLAATVVLVRIGWSADGGDALRQPVDRPPPLPAKLPADWLEFPAELAVVDSDIKIIKRQWGAFYGTDLDLQLRRRGIARVVLGGLMTNFGVESTARDGWQGNYTVIVAEDAASSFRTEMHEFAVKNTLPRCSLVRKSEEIIAALSKARAA